MPVEQPTSIPERNALMAQLLNENGTNAPTPTPAPTPKTRSFGQMLAHLLGLGG